MPESYWLEANWAQNVQIINNYIEGPYGGILVGLLRLYEQGSGVFLNHRYLQQARRPMWQRGVCCHAGLQSNCHDGRQTGEGSLSVQP